MKKKSKIIQLILMVILIISSSSYASELTLDYNDSTKNYSIENQFYIDEGTISSENYYKDQIRPFGQIGVKEKIFLNMKHYYQDGQTWSGYNMKTCGKTIGNAGCAVTSFTMITNYYGFNDDPGEVNSILGDLACGLHYVAAGNKYGLSLVGNVHASVSESYAKNYILGALRNNRPVLVGMKYGSSGTHFVVARGYFEEIYEPENGFYGRKYYYIYDPSANKDYMFLDDYFDDGYSVHRLKVYDN